MTSHDFPEDVPDTLRSAAANVGAYLHALRYVRGFGKAECLRIEEILRDRLPDLAECCGEEGCLVGAAVRELAAATKGRSAAARSQREVLLELADWLDGTVKPLTEQRVAELAALAGLSGVAVPDAGDVHLLLKTAEGMNTPESIQLAVAIYLAAFRGLKTTRICELKAGAIDWSGGTGCLAVQPKYRFALSEWEAFYLAYVTFWSSPTDPILQATEGQPLRPRYLRKQLAECVASLGDRLSEPLTLERLRDHAAYWCLDNGGTVQDVATMLGYTRVAGARRRFGGEAWAYLADREGNWFTLQAAAAAERRPAEELVAWTAAGLRHEQREGRVYVRKEDVRDFGGRPTPGIAPRQRSRGEVAVEPSGLAPEVQSSPLIAFVAAVGYEQPFDPELTEELLARRDVHAGAQLKDLHDRVGGVLAELVRLRETCPASTCAERVCAALGVPGLPPELRRATEFSDLRAVLMYVTPLWRGLDANLREVDFDRPGLASQLIAQTFHSPAGLDHFASTLDDPLGQAAFWLLVDRYLPRLQAHVEAIKRLHGVIREEFEPVWTGCLAYSFFVSVFAASPDVRVDPTWSAPEPETILFESLRYWLVLTLNGCGALQPRPRRELSFGRSFAREPDDQRFVEAFEDRWRSSLRYRRPPLSFDVVPTVSPFDIVRYAHLTFGRVGLGKKKIAQEATDHLVYLSKLPPSRLLLPPERLSVGPLRTLLYLAYHPLLEAQLNAAIRDAAQARNVDREAIGELLSPSLPETSRAMFDRAWSAFDFTRGTDKDGLVGSDPGSLAAFSSYLKINAQWHFRKLCRKSARRPAASLEGLGHGPVATQNASDMAAENSFLMDLVGAFGHAYIRIEWAVELTGESACWLQRRARELGAVRAGDRLNDEGRLVDPNLPPATYLLPYDSNFYDRVSKLRKRRPRSQTKGGDT